MASPSTLARPQDSRLVYHAANDERRVQTKNASGTFIDRLRVEANTDTPDIDAVDLPVKWTAGWAVTAGDYSIGRKVQIPVRVCYNMRWPRYFGAVCCDPTATRRRVYGLPKYKAVA